MVPILPGTRSRELSPATRGAGGAQPTFWKRSKVMRAYGVRGVVQLGLDAQAEAEVRLAQVAGADGVRRRRAGRGHARPVVTTLGEVVVRRIGYRSGVKGAVSLFPRDAVLDLPPGGYSWAL